MSFSRNIVLVIGLLAVIFSCSRDDEFFGPELAPAEADFELVDSLEATFTDIDFTEDSVTFNAKFSQKVSWKLNVKGLLSGAEFIAENTSDTIDVIWDGASQNVYHFRNDETVQAVVSFLGTDVTDTISLIIDETKDFGGFLISDYDGGGLVTGSWWQSFKPGELISHSEKYSEIPVPQGLNCIHMKGIDLDPEKFLGQTGHSGVIDYGLEEGFPGANDSLYFNCYMQGKKGTRVEVRISQTVDGAFDGSEYSTFIDINWDGWRLVSRPYSDFNRTGGIDSSPVKSAKLITRIKFVLRAVTGGDQVEANIDYPIFTAGKPFEQ